MSLVMALFSAGFTLLYILIAARRTARFTPARKDKIGFSDTLLVFLPAMLGMMALILARTETSQAPIHLATPTPETLPLAGVSVPIADATPLVLGIAAVWVIFGLILLPFEARRPERGLKGSRGVLSIGAGVILLITAVSVPLSYDALITEPSATPSLTPFGTPPPPSETPIASLTATIDPSPTVTASPTPSRTPLPTDTAAATRRSIATRTPEPTETLPNPCLASVTNNLNLRAEPATDGELLATIPFDTSLTLFARSSDGLWWFTEYNGQAGWVLGEFVARSSACDLLPTRTP